jgi:hypothetical protein
MAVSEQDVLNDIQRLNTTIDEVNTSREQFIRGMWRELHRIISTLAECIDDPRVIDIAEEQGIDLIALRRGLQQAIGRLQATRDSMGDANGTQLMSQLIEYYRPILRLLQRAKDPAIYGRYQLDQDRNALWGDDRLQFNPDGSLNAPPAPVSVSGSAFPSPPTSDPSTDFSVPGAGWGSFLPGSSGLVRPPAAAENSPPPPPLFTSTGAPGDVSGEVKDSAGAKLNVGDAVITTKSGKIATVRKLTPPDDIDISFDDTGEVANVKSNAITKRSSGGRLKRFKKTKRRRQKKSRKHKK